MKVLLAGYNVDTAVLNDMARQCPPRSDITPETFSAAYARISRDPRSIDEIRKDAREEVGRARRSNETIIFKMGHHSVAEHAVFNFDIIGISRLAMEALEKFRLCSYTEKSQRYITLQDDYVIPPEVKGSRFETAFVDLIKEQNACYHTLFDALRSWVFEQHKTATADPKKHALLEGWAKEDARYVTSLATEAQVGLTVNARNLELMFRRFSSHPLAEVRQLGRTMYECVKSIAPSIIIFHNANDFDEKTYPALHDFARAAVGDESAPVPSSTEGGVRLVHYDKEGDNLIAAALVHASTSYSFDECLEQVRRMRETEKQELFRIAGRYLQLYDTVVREFEYAHLTYDMVVSAACFGQLKRHRMATITAQSYNPQLGVTVPRSIKEVGLEGKFTDIVEKTNDFYYTIYAEMPSVAPYILCNGHQRRVLLQTNLRELYHIARLREDEHAQWDIREKSEQMSQRARSVMPYACMLLCGKNSFAQAYKEVYGESPVITEHALPGIRNID